MKTCTRCGETKPLDEYHRHTPSPDGHRAGCKECLRADDRARRTALSDEERARMNARRAKRVRARRAAQRANEPDPIALTGGRWERGRGGIRRWVT